MTEDKTKQRQALAAMTYEEWLADHRATPGGWLVMAAPEEILRACYADRLATFDWSQSHES
jgi:hypothetical protein